MRLADEYDGAQERGEVGKSGSRSDLVGDHNEVIPSAADLGLRRDEIHEARKLRDAEKADPGKAERTLNGIVPRGEEPTKARWRNMTARGNVERLPPDGMGVALALWTTTPSQQSQVITTHFQGGLSRAGLADRAGAVPVTTHFKGGLSQSYDVARDRVVRKRCEHPLASSA
jgi:hypothetical protein